jgi:hypothetical protein
LAIEQLDQKAVDGELEGTGRELLATCHANVAAVRLKQEQWADAVASCSLSLTHLAFLESPMSIADDGDTATRKFQASRVKALFRRGTARERLSDPNNAAADFRAAAAAANVG